MSVKGRVSVVIPSRNERYLRATVVDLLAKAAGDVEILVMLEGPPWPDPPLPADPRVRVLYSETPRGMRPAINAGAQAATGEYLLKCDAHIAVGDGYDAILKADCDHDWLVVPTRHSLDGERWVSLRRDFNYSILTYPFLGATMYGEGFHAVTLPQALNKTVNQARAHLPIDDILSAQGSLWFTPRAYFLSFPPLDHETFYFYQEAQCVMMRVLASGGRCVVNKRTQYAHWHKGKESRGADGRPGRGFYLDLRKKRLAESRMVQKILTNDWPQCVRTFTQIVEQHWWLISQVTDPRYAWPADWADWEKHRRAFEARTPDQVPAHL